MAVAIASSPVFSPSRITVSCKGSPETLNLVQMSPSAADAVQPSSPFLSRFQRAAGGLRAIRVGLDSSSSSSPPPTPSQPPAGTGTGAVGSGSVLKRKRPMCIDIPMTEPAAATFAAPGSDGMREVMAESARCSVYCKRGKKKLEMEDRYQVALDIDGDPKLAFFGIFDGHGGKRAAEFASENLGERILEEVSAGGGETSSKLEEAVKIGYVRTDSEFLQEDVGGGACCVTALIRNGNVAVSHAGDCRAVLSRAGRAQSLTTDHKPSRDDERDRIESLGGYVEYFRGTWRLQGSLAVSRGIGDAHLKQWVIPEPETKIVSIEAECEFLILASDGLWDKVSNQEAVDIARPLCMSKENPSPLSACRKLANLSATRGSLDDISVMILQLQHFS